MIEPSWQLFHQPRSQLREQVRYEHAPSKATFRDTPTRARAFFWRRIRAKNQESIPYYF